MPLRFAALTLVACLIFTTNNVATGADFSSAGDPEYPSRCQDRSVLNWITGNFAWAERNQWQRGFTIEEISSPRLRYQVNYGPSIIAHDHCQAQARMTNGRVWPVYYTVERGQGFASIGDKVRYCIVGLDPWHVYGAACSTVR